MMKKFTNTNFISFLSLIIVLSFLNSCGIYRPVDAKEFPPDPKLRIKKNMEEGRGFRLLGGDKQGGVFDFASSNELWRASLDTIDFMPLSSANYSGGIIITDWYSDKTDSSESIKISIRFLSNEVRSDALDIKAFNRKCSGELKCKITEIDGNLITELKKKILKTAALYKEENKSKEKDKN